MTLPRSFLNPLRTIFRASLGDVFSSIVYSYYAFRRKIGAEQHSQSLPQHDLKSDFDIDVVYTWVDDSNQKWILDYEHYYEKVNKKLTVHGAKHTSRFHNRNELLYSLRSIATNANFVRNIFIVTGSDAPPWLDIGNSRIRFVAHSELFNDTSVLPTFNSHAIESQLHHIKGLSEHYIYMNDDVFFGAPVHPSDFFTTDGKSIAYLSNNRIPSGASYITDTAADCAAKNDRELIAKKFGFEATRKFLHVPHSQLKSVLYEIEQLFPHELNTTSHNRFRSVLDISLPTCLYHYYAFCINKGVLKPYNSIAFRYINVASPYLKPVLTLIDQSKRYKIFCINEPVSADLDTSKFDQIVSDFLEKYFPKKCEFEI